MSNHYHLLVKTPDANLSRGMRQLNDVYTQAYNRRHGRNGHVFRGRYKAILVEKILPAGAVPLYCAQSRAGRHGAISPQLALEQLSRNSWPVRMVLPVCKANGYWQPSGEGRRTRSNAIRSSSRRGKASLLPGRRCAIKCIWGSDPFVEKIQSLIDGNKELSEIPSSQRRPKPQELEYYEASSQNRNTAIVRAYHSCGYTMNGVGEYFGLHYSTISGIINNHK